MLLVVDPLSPAAGGPAAAAGLVAAPVGTSVGRPTARRVVALVGCKASHRFLDGWIE